MQCVLLCVCVCLFRSVLRDKSVVQGAIKTLQEEVGALKSTNMELQNQLCLVSASACCVVDDCTLDTRLQGGCLAVYPSAH